MNDTKIEMMESQKDFEKTAGPASPVKRFVRPPIMETERCPNCGQLYYLGECNYYSSIKTVWGGSTLYGVCKKCKDVHDSMAA